MSPRPKPVTVPLSVLPAFLRDLTAAELVAVALEAQAQVTKEAAHVDGISPVVSAGIMAQANAYAYSADEIRKAADTIAAVHADPNGVSPA